MTKQRLGILGGMGRPPPRGPGGGPPARIRAGPKELPPRQGFGGGPTRLAPCGDPDDLICSGQLNCPGIKVWAVGQNACDAALAASGPMPLHDRRDGYV